MAKIKRLVSRRKRRFNADGFDLDLTYIKPNLIAMGFPAEKLEGIYRNRMEDVVRFFDQRHSNHYKVYNLCSERWYEPNKFHGQSAYYPFADHNPPPFELIAPFCEDVDEFLNGHERNVVAVHCKAGKGRTGVMLCCYMLHCRLFKESWRVMQFYGEARTSDTKGVTIPSQRRCVHYYDILLRYQLTYVPVTLLLKGFSLIGVPNFSKGCNPSFCVSGMEEKIFMSKAFDFVSAEQDVIDMVLTRPIPVAGDVKVEFFHQPNRFRKEKMFQFWINTFFVSNGVLDGKGGIAESSIGGGMRLHDEMTLILSREELDKANKDKKHFPPKFQVKTLFTTVGSGSGGGGSGGGGGCDSISVSGEEEIDGEDTYNYSDTDTEEEDDDDWKGELDETDSPYRRSHSWWDDDDQQEQCFTKRSLSLIEEQVSDTDDDDDDDDM
ncbi:phosphatidylinositol 3,4,5-trisphosphate 3-phosphatase and dual-specificity protein phosphatase PTEN-like isoform X3 [Oscarella lobularis]|uniref:phosphatidylinositol 3,4,5-trisphosphate 3-phosphatase and dual-specificity protein phosphatase PTEN-like isoform X3 n=1 Tax=Oscarella lobularis TaxID=121494 RepID=UPI00331381B1